jgi:hypothetical protein
MQTYVGKIKTSKTTEDALSRLLALNVRFQNELLNLSIETVDGGGSTLSKFDLIQFEQTWEHFKELPSDIKGRTADRVAKGIQ